MAVDESARHALYQRLAQTLGEEATTTLMAYLPPAGWGDVVTRSDLDQRLTVVESRILGEMHRELSATTRTVVFSVIGTNVALATLALAVSRLFS